MIVSLTDALVAVLSLALGYVAGSIPISALVGRAAGVDVLSDGDRNPGAANVWKLAGPGWGLLALSGDLAKGALPVAIATVTFSWNAGWLAAMGAAIGAGWPLLRVRAGGRAVATFCGAAAALAPPAGIVGFALAGIVVGAGRAVRRNTRVLAIAIAVAGYPVLFHGVYGDGRRLLALLLLYAVALARYRATRGRPAPRAG